MKTLGRILCAIDLEKASERALRPCAESRSDRRGQAVSAARNACERSVRLAVARAARIPHQLRERAEAAGVRVRVEEQHGDPADVIVLHAHPERPISLCSDRIDVAAGAG